MVIASHNRERDRRREGVAMKFIIRVLPVVALLGATSPAFAVCSDPAGAAAVRAQCDCAGARNHGQYVSCVSGATNAAIKAGTLPKDCASTVMDCASNSTCGKPGFVTCCQTAASGTTTCSVANGASECTAPSGGSACVGTQPSCCDACPAGGCGGGTTSTTLPRTTIAVTTTTTVATTTTTLATTTTTVPTTTTTTLPTCTCAGGTPTKTKFTTGVGSGTCGHLDSDSTANTETLTCGGLFFGGSSVAV